MYLLLLLLFGAASAWGDTLPLMIRAQTDFERVVLVPSPQLADAATCVQSEAAMVPVARPEELSQVHFRKGYCLLLHSVLTRDPGESRQADTEFRAALSSWPVPKGAASALPPDAAGLSILSAIARIEAGLDGKNLPDLERDLENSATQPGCTGTVIPLSICQSTLATGRLWQAWLAERQDHLPQAARLLQTFSGSGWAYWVTARESLDSRRYSEAASAFQEALRAWGVRRAPVGTLSFLAPQPDIPRAQEALGAAQFLAGDAAAAVATLDTGIRGVRGQDARAIFVRALARDALGNSKGALEDYNLASRTALAHASDSSPSGEGRYYRGVWLFRQKDYERAETEFASALNQGVGAALRADVTAWWRLTPVARGECDSSVSYLRSSLETVSGFFPRQEAELMLDRCSKVSALHRQ